MSRQSCVDWHGQWTPRLFFAALCATALWCLAAAPARSAEFILTTESDEVDLIPGDGFCNTASGNCSIRAAVQEANTLIGGPHKVVLLNGDITLSIGGASEDASATGDLDITASMIFEGQATATETILQAGTTTSNGIDRVIHVHGGVTLTISGITIRYGNAPAGQDGGGIQVENNASVIMTDVIVQQNRADAGGGMNVAGSVTVNRSTFSGNTARAGAGGGVRFGVLGGDSSMSRSTLSGNQATTGGAGIHHLLILNNDLTVEASTITANHTLGNGSEDAGVRRSGGGAFTIGGSIVGRNTNSVGTKDCSGTISSTGGNLSSDTSCGFSNAGVNDAQGLDPMLGSLAVSVGRTPTHMPFFGSPAIDTRPGCVVGIDQREVARPQGAGCEKGSVEVRVLTVDSTGDDPSRTACTSAGSDCSLRGAIRNVNGRFSVTRSGDIVRVPAGTYTVNSNPVAGSEDSNAEDDLDILASMEIVGDGPLSTTIQAAVAPDTGPDRVMQIHSPAVATISKVTIRHGFTANQGGGINIASGATADLTEVALTENRTNGIKNAGTLTMRRSSVTASVAGAVVIAGNSAVTTLENVTLSDNFSATLGSAFNVDGSGNVTTMNNVTIANNQNSGSSSTDAAIYRAGGGVTIRNSIISGNTNGAGVRNCDAPPTSAGNNLSNDSSCGFTNAGIGDMSNVDPLLQALGTGGGTTSAHLLNNGSPARDAGNAGTPGTGGNTCASTDQHGTTRSIDGDGIAGARCDMGAIEAPDDPCAPKPDLLRSVTSGGPNTLLVNVTAGRGVISRIRGIPAKSTNILVDINGQFNQPSSFDITFSGPLFANQAFSLHRQSNSGSGTLALYVTDDCGDYELFFGGGIDAWGTGSFTLEDNGRVGSSQPLLGPTPTSTPTPAPSPMGTPMGLAIPTTTPTPVTPASVAGPPGSLLPTPTPTSTPTMATQPKVTPTPTATPVAGAACASFASHAEAQRSLRNNPTDPLVIDRNGNGIACEGADGAGFMNPPIDTDPVRRR